MKRLIIGLLMVALLCLPSCISQDDLDNAYNEGYSAGYAQCQVDDLDGPLVGSKNSDIYHYPWCISAQQILPENEVWFDTVEEAQAAGYRPCQVCHPPN